MKEFPKVDNRKQKELEQQILQLAAQYVPEWKPDLEDAGLTLVHIFTKMLEGTLERLNHMPYKNYIYFLNLLGAKQSPAVPASGYLKIELTGSVPEGIRIPKGTRFYGEAEEGIRVLFETVNECRAVTNGIETIYQVGENADVLTALSVKSEETDFSEFILFEPEGENLQERRFVFTQPNTLNGTTALTVRVQIFYRNRTVLFTNPLIVCWEQKTKDGWQPVLWNEDSNKDLILKLPECEEEIEYRGKRGRFLSCRLLSKAEIKEVAFTQIRVGAFKTDILPDCLYYNDHQLSGEQILPFGERFSVYDEFLLGCREAFSKSGARIKITFALSFESAEEQIEKETDEFPDNGYKLTRTGKKKRKAIFTKKEEEEALEKFRTPIKVSWEYFNGLGWANLVADNSRAYEDIFSEKRTGKISMTFLCPEDIKEWIAGANTSLFIRARLLKVGNEQIPDARYLFPKLQTIRIQYTYEELPFVSTVFVEKNKTVEEKQLPTTIGEEITLYEKKKTLPTVYFKLAAPLTKGSISLFWKVKDRTEGIGTICVESYSKESGKAGWKRLAVTDETQGMKHSGRMILYCNEPSEPLSLFGTTGYFLRIVKPESTTEFICPKISAIEWNVVRLIQQESMEAEYFTADPSEIHKVCQLSEKNILEPEVWVDEEEIHQKENSLNDHWVKWEQRENLFLAKPEERVYLIDFAKGRVLFGDGKHGKLPALYHPCKIRINYRTCLGKKGNLSKEAVFGIADSIPAIRKVVALEAFVGGCDMQTSAQAAESFTETMKYLDRAVCEEDFELLAKKADRTISRAKVVSENGKFTLFILPKEPDNSQDYFEQIRQRVWEKLKENAAIVLTSEKILKIKEVTYIEFEVYVKAVLADTQDYFEVYEKIEQRLNHFFHPITGNFLGEGFEIGKLPTRMKIYHLIKTIEGIEVIKTLTVCCFERYQNKRRELSLEQAVKLSAAVPINGNHTIVLIADTLNIGGE